MKAKARMGPAARASIALLLGFLANATATAQTPPIPPTPAPTPIESLPPRSPLSPSTVAKLAAMKPLFDGRTLEGWIQAPVAPFRFASEDVNDLPALARRLTEKADPIAAWLAGEFDETGTKALADYVPTSATPAQTTATRSALLRNINRVVSAGASLYEPSRFTGVKLQSETEALRKKNPTANLELARLNRLLLEDAFSQELVRSPAAGWIVKDGAMASTGASRGSIYTAQDFSHYRLVFQVRQISGNHVPGVLVFCARPTTHGDLAEAQAGIDALGAVQFQVPNGGHWDYRPGMNKAGPHFSRPARIRVDLKEWAQIEILVNAKTGVARMAVAQPVGTRAIENLVFTDAAAGRVGPIALQMHNAGLFDEYRDLKIEIDPKEDRLITVESGAN